MTVTDFNQSMKKFFTECMNIMDTKGREYARDNEVLTDVRELSRALNISLVGILLVYMWKHVTALRYFVRNKNVESEAIRSRLKDIANYAGMIAVVLEVGEDRMFSNGLTPVIKVEDHVSPALESTSSAIDRLRK